MRVLYIAGAMRSGSTVLSDALGAQVDALNVGELSLFWRDVVRGGTCACGQQIVDCPVWSKALQEVSKEGWRQSQWPNLAASRGTWNPNRALPHILPAVVLGHQMREEHSMLIEATRVLLRRALEETGARTVVDSSKVLTGILFHLAAGNEIFVVHLVRDPRAVVASERRSMEVERGNSEFLPPGAGAVSAVLKWIRTHALLLVALPVLRVPHQVVLYEDFVREPERVLREICTRTDTAFSTDTVRDGVLNLPEAGHAAVGNPVRLAGARRRLTLDERWKNELSTLQATLIHVLTYPLRSILRGPALQTPRHARGTALRF